MASNPSHSGSSVHSRPNSRAWPCLPPPTSSCRASPMAAISAAMLSVLAKTSISTMATVIHSGSTRRMPAARPRPVNQPMRALMSWTAIISGVVSTRVHSSPAPKRAPDCEYVASPLGSSSAAPVINPGPRVSTRRRVRSGIFFIYARSSADSALSTEAVSGRTPRHRWKDSAACSTSMPRPMMARAQPRCSAQRVNGVSSRP